VDRAGKEQGKADRITDAIIEKQSRKDGFFFMPETAKKRKQYL
jgi:hypothetical protein